MNAASPLILVTGATGFLGAAVVQQLRAQNCRLRTTGRRNLPAGLLPDYRSADLCDSDAVARMMEGVDVVVHVAGLAHRKPHVSYSQADYTRINSRCCKVIARAAARQGCGRMVLVSSVAVYGGGVESTSESHPCRPDSEYAQSKHESEQLAAVAAASTGMELVILRMATIYGEGDPGNVGRLLRAIERRRFIWVGRGHNHKSLIHVEDAARACATVALCPSLPSAGVFNVSARPCTMVDLVSLVAESLGRRKPMLTLPGPALVKMAACAGFIPGLDKVTRRARALLDKWTSEEVYDSSLFCNQFQWSPQVSLPEGIARQVNWYRRNQSAARAS